MRLFWTAFMQVFFVALNTWLIAHEYYAPAVVTAFAISFIWTFNVKKVAFGTTKDRITYALGAAIGSGVGLFTTYLIKTL